MEQWHGVVKLVWDLVIDAFMLAVVAGAIHIETVNQDTILRLRFHLFWLLSLDYFKRECKLVNSDLVLAGVRLQDTSQEALWEEEAGNPVGIRVATC